MSRGIILAVKPDELHKMEERKITDIVIKNAPELKAPFVVYVYCDTNPEAAVWSNVPRNNVVGEFVCDKITCIKDKEKADGLFNIDGLKLNMGTIQIDYFLSGFEKGWAIHIKQFERYNNPRSMSEFDSGGTPRTWLYVENAKMPKKKSKRAESATELPHFDFKKWIRD